jgi:hypothetical protein
MIHAFSAASQERPAARRLITVARWLAADGVVRVFQPRTEYYDLPAQQVMASDSFGITTRYWRLSLTTVERCRKPWPKNAR